MGSQARGLIEKVATGPHQSHSNARSEPSHWPTPQLTAMLDINPPIKARDRTQNLMVRFHCAMTGTPILPLYFFNVDTTKFLILYVAHI